jgi:hypothetical protein
MTNGANVPSGTEIDSPNYVKLVEQYRLFARKTAETSTFIGSVEMSDLSLRVRLFANL